MKESILPDIKFNTKLNLQTQSNKVMFAAKMLCVLPKNNQYSSLSLHIKQREKREKNNLISLSFILLISKVGQSLPYSEHYHP